MHFSRRATIAMTAVCAACGARATPPVAPLPRDLPPTASTAPEETAAAPSETANDVPPTPAPQTEQHPKPPPLNALWGTPNPIAFVAASPDRRWVAVCQARADTNGDGKISVEAGPQGELRGDRLSGYFIDTPGWGTDIDAFGGSDPTGRYVAFVHEGRLVLRDTTSHMDTDLSAFGADTRDDLGSFLHPRAVAFDPTGRRVLYLRRTGDREVVAVRELANGAETTIDPGLGELWRADFDFSGEWVILRVVAADTNGDGRLDWTMRAAPAPYQRCAGPLPRFAVWERPGDAATIRVARADAGGVTRDAPGLVAPFGDALVERDADGAFFVVKPNGQKTMLTKKSCESRLLHADPTRQALIVTCATKNGHADVDLLGRGTVKPLGIEMVGGGGDHAFPGSPRLVPLQPGRGAVLVDLDRGDVEHLTTGDRILATAGTNALVLRGRALVLHAHDGGDRKFDGDVLPLVHWLHQGAVYVAPPFVVDVARGAVLGRIDVPAYAVSDDGAVLTAEGRSADATRFAVGPLKWRAPEGAAPADSAAPSAAIDRPRQDVEPAYSER